jgi:hypothetical protein
MSDLRWRTLYTVTTSGEAIGTCKREGDVDVVTAYLMIYHHKDSMLAPQCRVAYFTTHKTASDTAQALAVIPGRPKTMTGFRAARMSKDGFTMLWDNDAHRLDRVYKYTVNQVVIDAHAVPAEDIIAGPLPPAAFQ